MDGGGRVFEPLTTGASGGSRDRVTLPPTLEEISERHYRREAAPIPVAPRRWRAGRVLALGVPFSFRRRSVAVPLARRLPSLTGTWLALGFFGAIGIYGLSLNGDLADLKAAYGEPRDMVARALGLGVDKVTISGLVTLTVPEVLEAAGISPRSSLPFLSAAEVRERLEKMPLVSSAEVRKTFPGNVTLALVERVPFALWQKDGELFVIAKDGAVIDRLRDARLADLPLVVGDKANLKAAEYVSLLDAAGAIRGRVRAGMLIAGRRWNLKMENGLDVRLPEDGAKTAVERLARLQREQGLLEKDVLAVDLRMPDRVVVRLTEEAAAARNEGKKKPLRGVKGIET